MVKWKVKYDVLVLVKKALKFSCSDGTQGKITYDGNWGIAITETGDKFNRIVLCIPDETPHTDPDAKGCSDYSDVLILNDGIDWIKVGRKTYKK